MKASELIEQLQILIEANGDLQIVGYNWNAQDYGEIKYIDYNPDFQDEPVFIIDRPEY